MAELYLARHVDRPQLQKLWVVKRVMPHLAESPEFVRMFQNEARLASTLDHSHIVEVVDYGIAGDEHYLVMEYVHGKDARAVLRAASEGEGLPLEDALTIVTRVAAALHYAHERRDDDGALLEIVHRDVSPSNVLIGYDGTVQLTDFGIAKAVAQTNVTRTGTIKGKAGYMSPEQCRGERVDRSADVFGLGVLLHELTTLRRAFFAPSDLAIMSKIVAGEFRLPRQIVPDYPEALQGIVTRALAVAPADRFPTAAAFAQAVEAFARDHGLCPSTTGLSDTVIRLFGSPPYPTDTLDDALAIEPPQLPADEALEPTPRQSGWRMPALAAAALGLAGFALGATLNDVQAPARDSASIGTAPPPGVEADDVATDRNRAAGTGSPHERVEPTPNGATEAGLSVRPSLRSGAAGPSVRPSLRSGAAGPSVRPSLRSGAAGTTLNDAPEEVIVIEEPDSRSHRRKRSRKRKAAQAESSAEDKRKTFGPPQWGK
jgi:serine/threonine-protein kinase